MSLRNLIAASMVFALFAVAACGVKAEAVPSATPDSMTFWLETSKDPGMSQWWANETTGAYYFELVITSLADGLGATFNFSLTDLGVEAGLGDGKDGVKFKDFTIREGSGTGDGKVWNTYFSGNGFWDNGGWLPTSATFQFADGMDWDTFYADFTAEDSLLYVSAHMQALNVTSGGDSINEGKYTLRGTPDTGKKDVTPEPATLLMLGLGAGALPLARRFRRK